MEYKPYAYMVDGNGTFKTIDGHKCKKIYSWSDEAETIGNLYEFDVPPLTRFLIDKYQDSDELANNNKILYIDIELEKGEKYGTVDEAANVINAISYRLSDSEDYIALLLDRDNKPYKEEYDVEIETSNGIKVVKAKLETFQTEKKLLATFIKYYEKFDHNIITGWNTDFFDMPYLFNRLVKVHSWTTAKKLSPIGIVEKKFSSRGPTLIIAGVTVLDYLMLYKLFTYTEQPNYRLDTISKFELGRGKIEYEGDLDELYNTDKLKYIKYNIVDVELCVSLNEKMDLIDIGLGICHSGHVPHAHVPYPTSYLDGASLVFCKRKGLVASSNLAVNSESARGAFVKEPIPGLYSWVYGLDLTSLYPMNMITLNISPETKFGKVLDYDQTEYLKNTSSDYKVEIYKDTSPVGQFEDAFFKPKSNNVSLNGSDELRSYLDKHNLSLASNGVMYSQEKQGIIPAILDGWFNDRSEFKRLRSVAMKEGDQEKVVYYNRKQLITKIKLNSFYGVLLQKRFRFYDLDSGEAVTITGQEVIHHASRAADYHYNKKLEDVNCEYVIEMENGTMKKFNGLDRVQTENGETYVFNLTEDDVLI